jgi:phage baseplate assembly protein W
VSFILGRGWSFPPRFNPLTKQVEMVSEIEDIEESLRILFTTDPGERVMLPAYGCALRRLVFDNFSEHALTSLKDMIRKSILFFEPRILLHRVAATMADPLEGVLQIQIDYSIRTTNTRHNLVFPMYLHQATNPVATS